MFAENSVDFRIDFLFDQASLDSAGLTTVHTSTRWLHISWTDDIAHTHLFDHHFGSIGALLEITRSSSSYLIFSVDYFFSDSSSKSDTNSILEILFSIHTRFHCLFFRGEDCHTTSSSSWHDRDFVYEVIVGHEGTEESMTAFVVCYKFLTLVTKCDTFFLETDLDSIDRIINIYSIDYSLLSTS